MLFRDGAEHHRLRVLGNRGFTPSMLERAKPMVQRIVDGLLDSAQQAGKMDAVTDFAQPLPALAIAELFDIPKTDRDLFQKWSDNAAKFFGGNLTDPETEAKAANDGVVALEGYFLNMIKHRRDKPGNDLVSLLLAGQAEGKLTAEEVSAQCILILVAGHVTTIDLTSNAINVLLDHPDQWKVLVADPSKIPAAVDERCGTTPRCRSSTGSSAGTRRSAARSSNRGRWCTSGWPRPTATRRCSPTPTSSTLPDRTAPTT